MHPIIFAQASTVVPNAVANPQQVTFSLKSKPRSVDPAACVVAKMKRVKILAVSQPAWLTAAGATMEGTIQKIKRNALK